MWIVMAAAPPRVSTLEKRKTRLMIFVLLHSCAISWFGFHFWKAPESTDPHFPLARFPHSSRSWGYIGCALILSTQSHCLSPVVVNTQEI
jgi:peptidoglycan/LPS O-acetylase OafA/YrhL